MESSLLTNAENSLLREAIINRNESLIYLLDTLGIKPLTIEQRQDLRGAIADELVFAGLNEDDEPNERGMALESLIDKLSHL